VCHLVIKVLNTRSLVYLAHIDHHFLPTLTIAQKLGMLDSRAAPTPSRRNYCLQSSRVRLKLQQTATEALCVCRTRAVLQKVSSQIQTEVSWSAGSKFN